MPMFLLFFLGLMVVGVAAAAAMPMTIERAKRIAVDLNTWAARNLGPEDNKLIGRVILTRVKQKGSFRALTYGDIYDGLVAGMSGEKWQKLYRDLPYLRQYLRPGERPPNQHETIPPDYADGLKQFFSLQIGARKRLRLFTLVSRALIR